MWEELEQKYGIKFKNEDGTFRTVDEWFKDVYLQSPSTFEEMSEEIFLKGDKLFDIKE